MCECGGREVVHVLIGSYVIGSKITKEVDYPYGVFLIEI